MLELPAMNDQVILQMVINDLQEHHGRTEQEAIDESQEFCESIIEAMWSEYSHVLSECAEGRY